MGSVHSPEPVKLIAATMGQTAAMLDLGRAMLEERFGAVDAESEIYPFTFSGYYAEEMGDALLKRFLSFAEKVDPGALASIKRATNAMERTVSRPDGLPGRGVNLDPGYVNGAQLVLATTKNYSHRIYIGEGIYAEVTLRYQRGGFEPLPWTYPDYQTDLARAYFARVRLIHLEQR